MLFEPIHTTSIDEYKPSLVMRKNEKLVLGNKLWNKQEELANNQPVWSICCFFK